MKICSIALLSASTLILFGCATQDEQKKNMSEVTSKNVQYLRSLGYKITSIDKRTGYIQAYNKNGGISPDDLKIFYPNQQINPYTAVNSVVGGEEISSITIYWLPGKEQLARQDRESAHAESEVHKPIEPAIQDSNSSNQGYDILKPLVHKD